MAFQHWNGENYVLDGFSNFKEMFANLADQGSALRKAIKVSLFLYLLGWLVKPINLFFPFYIYKKMPAHEFFRVILFLPQILSHTIIALLFKCIADGFPVELWGFQQGFISSLDTRFWTVWVFEVFIGFGGLVLIYTSNMSRIPESLVEYAKLEGCTPMQEFVKITFPLIFPTFATYLLIGVSSIFTNQMGLYTFFSQGSVGQLETVGYHLFVMTIKDGAAAYYPYASAVGVFFTLIVAPLTLLFRWGSNKIFADAQY
jgi:ABC-type sugar transport system permease subunit